MTYNTFMISYLTMMVLGIVENTAIIIVCFRNKVNNMENLIDAFMVHTVFLLVNQRDNLNNECQVYKNFKHQSFIFQLPKYNS